MKLYLLRHAIAADHGTPGYDADSERPLTPEGEEKMRRIAEGMKALDLNFDIILSSPYVRAKQTAEIVAEVLQCPEALQLTATLAAAHPTAVIQEINQRHRVMERILLVGHEPYLSHLISVLVTGTNAAEIVMKKGGLCKLDAGELQYGRCASLRWLMTPSQLMRLAS